MYPLKETGEYSKGWVKFLAAVRKRTAELLDTNSRDVRPGIDYVITEVVHCKSRNEIGVNSAANTCVNQYLQRVIAISGAAVIVPLGAYAASHIRYEYNVPASTSLFGPIKIGSKSRFFAFLPHPNYRGKRTFADCLPQAELERLRHVLHRDMN